MFGRKRLVVFAAVIAVFFEFVAVQCVWGQGLQNVLRARTRVFTAVGPGVVAVKRDSSGRYFILAEPASVISIFDAAGKLLGQFPNANSHGATIRYAVSIDLDSHGRLFVADRGDNAVKVFSPDGSFLGTIHVAAPTSVVALPDGQFAVTSLQSQRLVQIMDEAGNTVRTFGDPADLSGADAEPSAQSVVDRGRITGDSAGNLYFAFTSLPDPTLQRFDRFGYSAYTSVAPAGDFGPLAGRGGHEIDLGYQMSGITGPTSVGAWTDLHSLKAVSVGSRAGRGREGASAASAATSTSPTGTDSTADGNVLSYNSDPSSGILDFNSSALSSTDSWDFGSTLGQSFLMPGMVGMGFGDPFRGGMMREFHEEGGARPDFAGRSFAGGEGFERGHPGYGLYRASATLRVALDDPSKHAPQKPVITAVGVDPEIQEAWAAVGDTLVHLDANGNRLDTYYPTISDGGSALKITSILVEQDRLLIAADPWGIYEFPRPDKPSPSATQPQNRIVPQQLSLAPNSPAAR